MRFKVKSPDTDTHAAARAIVTESGNLVLENPRRLTLSIEDPSKAVIDHLERVGAHAAPEYQYDQD
jgi:hypothetical protein